MKVIVKAIAGSHLFGTNTPESDIDYKGIYLPEPKDIILGKFKDQLKSLQEMINLKTPKTILMQN